ncbi:MAG: ferritin, partial [Flammeovirgaceae bacterium]|nr:ferritin [Flammeovirgaceae bacterium]MDW8288895.1 ferritin [Flammeovirgaceae bacterium]
FHYVNNSGGHALAPELTEIRHDFNSLREIFEAVLEHEVAVTKSISKLVDACFEAKDFLTFQFLQWFIAEQREEEELARRIIDLFNIIGEEGQGLWLIDQEIGRLHAALKKDDESVSEEEDI